LKSGSRNLLEPSGPVQDCNGTALTLMIKNPTLILEAKTGIRMEERMFIRRGNKRKKTLNYIFEAI